MLGTVVVGVVFTDIKGFSMENYVPEGRNLGKIKFVHGGVSRNIAEDIAVSGMPVTFVSMTEDSSLGRDVTERLGKNGVNTEFILPVASNGIGKWMVILNPDGDVAGQISSPPDMKPLSEFIHAYGDAFVQDATNIILEMDIGEDISEYVLSLAEKYNKKVYAIVGNMSVLSKRLDFIRRTDCFICNEIEISRLFEMDLTEATPEEMQAALITQVPMRHFPSTVVTMGEHGSVFFDVKANRSGIVPAIPTPVIDTSGAGDSFLAGTVMGFTNGLDLADAISLGTSLASLTIRSRESSCPKNALAKEFQTQNQRLCANV